MHRGDLLLLIQSRTAPSAATVPADPVTASGNTETIGEVLYSTYLFPFEVASLILLVAMIGAIILAKKDIGESCVTSFFFLFFVT